MSSVCTIWTETLAPKLSTHLVIPILFQKSLLIFYKLKNKVLVITICSLSASPLVLTADVMLTESPLQYSSNETSTCPQPNNLPITPHQKEDLLVNRLRKR